MMDSHSESPGMVLKKNTSVPKHEGISSSSYQRESNTFASETMHLKASSTVENHHEHYGISTVTELSSRVHRAFLAPIAHLGIFCFEEYVLRTSITGKGTALYERYFPCP